MARTGRDFPARPISSSLLLAEPTTPVDAAPLGFVWDLVAEVSSPVEDLKWDLRATVDGSGLDLRWDLQVVVEVDRRLDLVWDLYAIPTVVGVGAEAAGTGDVTVGRPAGVEEGDLLVIVIETNEVGTVTPPAGWSHAPDSPVVAD